MIAGVSDVKSIVAGTIYAIAGVQASSVLGKPRARHRRIFLTKIAPGDLDIAVIGQLPAAQLALDD
jgi:hypothetical protein